MLTNNTAPFEVPHNENEDKQLLSQNMEKIPAKNYVPSPNISKTLNIQTKVYFPFLK